MFVGVRTVSVLIALAPAAFGAETPALTRLAGTYGALPGSGGQLIAALTPAASGDWVTFVGAHFDGAVSLFRWSPATGMEQVFSSLDLAAYGFDEPVEYLNIRDHAVDAEGRVLLVLDVVPADITQEVSGLWLWDEGQVVELLRSGESVSGFDGLFLGAAGSHFLPSGTAVATILTDLEKAVGLWADGIWSKLDSSGILYQGTTPVQAVFYAQMPGFDVAQAVDELFRRTPSQSAWEPWPGSCCLVGRFRPVADGIAAVAWTGELPTQVHFYPDTLAEPEVLVDIAEVPASTGGPALAFRDTLSGAGSRLALNVGYGTPGVIVHDADGDLIPIARPGDVLAGQSVVGDAQVQWGGMAEHRLAFSAATSTGFEVWIADFAHGNPITVPTLSPLGIAVLAAGLGLAGLCRVAARGRRTAGGGA